MSTVLDTLKSYTAVVADTGDFNSIELFKPEDATTNPSLILQACKMPQYAAVVDATIKEAKEGHKGSVEELVNEICDRLAVEFGKRILKVVPGRVSTEVDATMSFDTKESVAQGRKIIKMYESAGIQKDRIYVKLASTWEGIAACKILEEEGINCNMTLIFSLTQAMGAAEAGASLISPFVGRILDWHVKHQPPSTPDDYANEKDPGVKSVRSIYGYYKKHGYKTIVMGASFRNTGEITSLCGCDRLTISPKLLDELSKMTTPLERVLSPESAAQDCKLEKEVLTESRYRWLMNEDTMANDKLSEGIRNFAGDLLKLKDLIKTKL